MINKDFIKKISRDNKILNILTLISILLMFFKLKTSSSFMVVGASFIIAGVFIFRAKKESLVKNGKNHLQVMRNNLGSDLPPIYSLEISELLVFSYIIFICISIFMLIIC